MLYHHHRNYGCRISTDYFYKDLRVAILENEYLRISILIDKGTDIFEYLYKPKDIDFMWLSPWGINSPSKFVTTVASKDGNFMDYYEGGWQEIIPNFGYGGLYKGAEEGLHGEICLIPWLYQVVDDCPSKISIKFMVRTYRTPFYIEKILTLYKDDPKLYISEKIKNEGYVDIDFMWTHHPTFGGAFLEGNTTIDIPNNKIQYVLRPKNAIKKEEDNDMWPKFKGYDGKVIDFSKYSTVENKNLSMDEVCLGELEEGWYAITNLDKKVGFGMRWDIEDFPYLWIWRMYGKGNKNAPWWGRVQCMALEICSSFSPIGLNAAIKNNTAIKIKPQQEIKSSFMAIAYEKDNNIKKIDINGNVI